MVVPLIVPAPGHLRAILINNNATKTNEPLVDLILSAQYATHLKISNNPHFIGAVWETYVSAKEWYVMDDVAGPSYGDGVKIVYVQFGQGVVPPPASPTQFSGIFNATIILDTTPPVVGPVPIFINGGNLKTDRRQVALTLNASGAQSVELYNENDLSTLTGGTILPYQSTIQWVLSEGNGIKSVYVVFIDDVENRTSFFSSSISLIGQEIGQPVIIKPVDGTITTDKFVTIEGSGDPGSIVRINVEGER